MKRSAFLSIVFLLLCLSLYSKNIYVKEGLNGTGTKESPYGYLWIAINLAEPGDVIHVAEGTYYGKNSTGTFNIKKSSLTIAGGYNSDFSERDPFKYLTILKRIENYSGTDNSDPIIYGNGYPEDLDDITIDGFVLDGKTKNSYTAYGEIILEESCTAELLHILNTSNVIIRNCTFLNSAGGHINLGVTGEKNEISNCFILNTFQKGIQFTCLFDFNVVIKNNTVAFIWYYPRRGGGDGIWLDDNGIATLENNLIIYTQSLGVVNPNNPENSLKGNLFYQCQGGIYKYIDRYSNSENILVFRADDLELLNLYAEIYKLSESGDNIKENPNLNIDNEYLLNLINYWSNNPVNTSPELIEEWTRNLAYMSGEEDTEQFGTAYSLDNIFPVLLYDGPQGVKTDINFQVYNSEAN